LKGKRSAIRDLGGTPHSQENVDILRRGYEAFNRADIDTVMGLMDPDIEWQEPDVEGLPQRGTHHGPEAVATDVFGQIVGNWDDFQAVAEEFLDAGDRVVVLCHFQGRGKASGKTLDATYACRHKKYPLLKYSFATLRWQARPLTIPGQTNQGRSPPKLHAVQLTPTA